VHYLGVGDIEEMTRPDPYYNYDNWRLHHPDEDTDQCERCEQYFDKNDLVDHLCYDCQHNLDEELDND
jgi:methionyl-tRNA synthetase